jgi:hypothetical protein
VVRHPATSEVAVATREDPSLYCRQVPYSVRHIAAFDRAAICWRAKRQVYDRPRDRRGSGSANCARLDIELDHGLVERDVQCPSVVDDAPPRSEFDRRLPLANDPVFARACEQPMSLFRGVMASRSFTTTLQDEVTETLSVEHVCGILSHSC